MTVLVRISRKDADGLAIDDGAWAALDSRLGGVGHLTRSGSLLFAFDQRSADAISAVEAVLDATPALSGWREKLEVALYPA